MPPDLRADLPADEQSLHAARRFLGPPARSAASEHFAIIHTSRAELARDLLVRLEAVYRAHLAFAAELQLHPVRPAHKLELLLLADYAEYQAVARRLDIPLGDRLGFFDPGANRGVFFDLDTHPLIARLQDTLAAAEPERRARLAQRLERRRSALFATVVQHEAAHQIQANLHLTAAPERLPNWLAEGLATLFEPPPAPGQRAGGAPNDYRLYELHQLGSSGPGSWDDLPQFLADEATWCGGPCYPKAWAVTAYLRNEQPAKLAALLRAASDGEIPRDPSPRRTALERHLGPLDEHWVAQVRTWLTSVPFDDKDWQPIEKGD